MSYLVKCDDQCKNVEIKLKRNEQSNDISCNTEIRLFVSQQDKPIINHTKSECTNCNITCNQDPEKPSCNYMNISGDQFYLTVYPVQSSCESVALEFSYVTERQVKKFGRSLLYKWKPN